MNKPNDTTEAPMQSAAIDLQGIHVGVPSQPRPTPDMVELQQDMIEDLSLGVMGYSRHKIRFRRDGIRFHRAISVFVDR